MTDRENGRVTIEIRDTSEHESIIDLISKAKKSAEKELNRQKRIKKR